MGSSMGEMTGWHVGGLYGWEVRLIVKRSVGCLDMIEHRRSMSK